MFDETFIKIGQLKKPHGNLGFFRIAVFSQFLEDFIQRDFLFLDCDGFKVPFYMNEITQRGNALYVQLEDIDTAIKAEEYKGYSIFIPESDLSDANPVDDNSLEFKFLEGYQVVFEDGTFGSVRKIEPYPFQEMAFIEIGDHEFMIPMNTSYIVEINKDKKVLKLSLPEGLLEN